MSWAFKRSLEPKCDQAFFLCGQMCNFLHRLLRSVVKRSDWGKLRSFDFAVIELSNVPGFKQTTEFRAKALKVGKSKIDIERDRGKRRRLMWWLRL